MLKFNQGDSALNYYENKENLNSTLSESEFFQVWVVTREGLLIPINQEYVFINPLDLL